MRVAVTGATGRLGGVLVPYLWERGHTASKVGRRIPDGLDSEVLIHLAAPDWRDEDAVRDFARFNEQVARWSEVTGARVIAAGSWWQTADGDSRSLAYTRMKDDQQGMFGTTLVLFSVYGTRPTERSFLPRLIDAAKGRGSLAEASVEQRDWVHARDVCEAFRAALRGPEGVYDVATGTQWSPMELTISTLGHRVAVKPESPSCSPRYAHDRVLGWAPRIDVLSYIRASLLRGVA